MLAGRSCAGNWSIKSLLNGSVLTVRDPFYASSKTCSECGYGMEVLPLSVREWTCPACQTTHDRDVNAAINLKQNTWATRESTPGDRKALAWLAQQVKPAWSNQELCRG